MVGAVAAIAVCYVGVLLALIISGHFAAGFLSLSLFASGGQIVCGLAAIALLGRGSWRESFARLCSAEDLLVGLAMGLLGFAVSMLYVNGLQALFAADEWQVDDLGASLPVLILSVVILPPLVEEWLDRGVLWVALSRVSGPRVTIFCTALLFAFCHGLNGGGGLEVPHRFAVGLAFGWARHRSGSLLPGIVGHTLLNSLALATAY
ncbi:MAG: membrane protease YdiL (CAAX protease family) [Planctomycetota bacterium]